MEARKQITDQIQERFKELKEETRLLHSKWRWQHFRSAMFLLKLIYSRIWILITKLASGCIHFYIVQNESPAFDSFWNSFICKRRTEQFNKYRISLKCLFVKFSSFPQSLDKACHYGCMLEYYLRACLHGGGEPQVCQGTRLGRITRLSI